MQISCKSYVIENYMDNIMDLVFDPVFHDPSLYLEVFDKIHFPPTLLSQHPRPDMAKVICTYVLCFNRGLVLKQHTAPHHLETFALSLGKQKMAGQHALF